MLLNASVQMLGMQMATGRLFKETFIANQDNSQTLTPDCLALDMTKGTESERGETRSKPSSAINVMEEGGDQIGPCTHGRVLTECSTPGPH